MPAARFTPFFVGPLIVVTVLTPPEGDTITNAAPNITWTFAPGVQQAFRVRIWSDATQTQLVYDSGNVVSAAATHLVPDGTLRSSATYWLLVTIETADADFGQSDLVSFSTLFVPSVAVVNVTATAENDDCDAVGLNALPAARVDWDQVVPDGTETFQRYSVWRRPRFHPRHPDAGSELWERVASVAAVATTVWRDNCAASHVVYEYAVTWSALTDAGDTRTSARQPAPSNVMLKFDRVVLHDVQDPELFVILTPDTVDVSEEQSVTFQQVWGRRAPTAFVAGFRFATIDISLVPDAHLGTVWRDLRGLQDRQGVASTLCLRLGYKGERYFAAIQSPLTRQDGVAQYAPAVNLSETFYEEAVA